MRTRISFAQVCITQYRVEELPVLGQLIEQKPPPQRRADTVSFARGTGLDTYCAIEPLCVWVSGREHGFVSMVSSACAHIHTHRMIR